MQRAHRPPTHRLTPLTPQTGNWLGNQAWTLGLSWSGAAGFNAAAMKDWALPDGTVAGQARSFHGFTFLRVYDAGHMVFVSKQTHSRAQAQTAPCTLTHPDPPKPYQRRPSDQPKAALALLDALIFGTAPF